MSFLSDLILTAVCLSLVFGSMAFGIARGRRVKAESKPEHEHLGTIQSALLGLLALLLGFAFAGAMDRFVDRQDALAREANAIGTAYDRAGLSAAPEALRGHLRDYVAIRLELFRERREAKAREIIHRLDQRYGLLLQQTLNASESTPALANLLVTGVEAVDNELSARNALDRRHLPLEFIVIMIVASCVAMGTVGFGVGIAERRSVGAAYALAGLVGVTLCMTLDFDRPGQGLIQIDPAPLYELAEKVGAKP
ncbi:MAG: hypothetical protein HEQ23_12910 [Tepidisphaera sp.]